MMKLEIVSMLLTTYYLLPTSLSNTRDLTFVGKLSKADSTEIEVSHVATLSAATETARSRPSSELGLLLRSRYN